MVPSAHVLNMIEKYDTFSTSSPSAEMIVSRALHRRRRVNNITGSAGMVQPFS